MKTRLDVRKVGIAYGITYHEGLIAIQLKTFQRRTAEHEAAKF